MEKVPNKTYPKTSSTGRKLEDGELLRSNQSLADMQRSLFRRRWHSVVSVTVCVNNKETELLNCSLSACAQRLCSTARSK